MVAAILPGIVLASLLTLHAHPGEDYYWGLANGQWMLHHHRVLTHNVFSYALGHQPIVVTEWGFEILMGILHHLGGMAAVRALDVGAAALSTALVLVYARIRGAATSTLIWLSPVVGLLLAPELVQGRALSVGFGFFALELILLDRARRDARWLWLVGPLLALWVNLHGSALLGLGALVVEAAISLSGTRWPWLGDRSGHWRPRVGAVIWGVLWIGLTPWGWGLAYYDYRLSSNARIAQYIAEWASPSFHSLGPWLILAGPVIVLVRSLWGRPHSATETALLVLVLVAALRSFRMADYATVLMAGGVGAWASGRVAIPWGRTRLGAVWAGALAALTIIGVSNAAPQTAGTYVPVAAFRTLDTMASGRLLTTYAWGGYGLLDGRRAFVYGETDLFTGGSGRTFDQLVSLMFLTKDPEPLLDAYRVRYVLWEPGQALSVYLAASSHWRVVSRSARYVLFERQA